MNKFYLLLGASAVAVLSNPTVAQAFAIAAPGTEGLDVIAGGGSVVATYEGNSAAFSNDLYLMLDALGNPGDDGDLTNDYFIFNNQSSIVGSTVNIGTFISGQLLQFRLHVNNTNTDYFTGSGSLNPDGFPHARVQQNWQPNTTLVSFEDLFGGPFDYNDLSFSFTGTRTIATSVPEPFTIVGTLIGGTAALRMRRKLSKLSD